LAFGISSYLALRVFWVQRNPAALEPCFGKTMEKQWENHGKMVIYIAIMSGWWFGTWFFNGI
jgi:hypothetical protein